MRSDSECRGRSARVDAADFHPLNRPSEPAEAATEPARPSCFAFLLEVLPGSAGRGDAPVMARSAILECEGESIDGVCTTLVRVIRRCSPAPPYRAR